MLVEAGGRVLRERYELMTQIGQGGFSVVWLARDTSLGSYWAVKQVQNNSSVEFDSFLKEVELLSTLNYPNIPRIVDRIEEGEDYFVVMDFIDGSALSKLVNLEGPQDEKKVIEWAISVCDTMAYLHSNNPESGKRPIVYRDLKPDNLMLSPSGVVKLIDFGAAIFLVPGRKFSGDAIGTRGYAAPEQYGGASNILGEFSDIYCLGATMYYLSTGFTPEMPPNGVPSVRSKNPALSDAFEYCVSKCTADDPENRYQSFAELKAALENIEKLSGQYRKKQARRLVMFYTSLVLSVVFAVVGWFGYVGYQSDLEDRFQVSYQEAAAYDREGDYLNASRYYAQALQSKPSDRDTHVLLFNALLPHDGGENATAATMAAIDEMRKGYLDNPSSPMYQDPKLCYLVARRCIEVEDIEYARLAVNYIAIIKESPEYESGELNVREIQSFEVIASFQSQDSANADFELFDQTLINLEDYTDSGTLSVDEQLGNYYLLIRMLSTYPNNLPDAYTRAYEIGAKARNLLIRNAADETMTFNNIIPMYELIAVGQYNSANMSARDEDREQSFLNSIEWFGYLEDLKVDLTTTLELRKANAYRGVFDAYNTPSRRDRMDASIPRYLDKAIAMYEDVVARESQNFLAYVNLTNSYYDREMLLPVDERDFTLTLQTFQKTRQLANSDNTIPSTSIMQFSSLTKLLQNAGLEV